MRQPKRQCEDHRSKPRPEPRTAAPSSAPAEECDGDVLLHPRTSPATCKAQTSRHGEGRDSATRPGLGCRRSTQALFSSNGSSYECELYNSGDAVFSAKSQSKQSRRQSSASVALLPPQTGPGCSPLLHGWMGTRSWAPSVPTLSAHDLPPPGCWAKGRGVDWSPTLGSIQSSSLSRPPWEQLRGRELCPPHRVPKFPPWPDSFFCRKASFSMQVETDSIKESAVYEALHTHKALALPPTQPPASRWGTGCP